MSEELREILLDLQFYTHDRILYYEKHPQQPYDKKELAKDLDLLLNVARQDILDFVPTEKIEPPTCMLSMGQEYQRGYEKGFNTCITEFKRKLGAK